MAKQGEDWVKNVLENQGYKIEKVGREDIFAFKDILGIVIEEKDWKDPVKVFKNNIYQRGINGKWYYRKRSQVTKYGYEIKKRDAENKIYRYIICAYVVSNLEGRLVQPIFFRKFGTIFVINKSYFLIWIKSLEKTYMGESLIDNPSMYQGGN